MAASPPPDDGSTDEPTADIAGLRPVGRYPVDTLAADAPDLADDRTVHLAGRVVLWRRFGSLAFGHLRDRSGSVQISLSKRDLDPDLFKQWAKGVSLGDFIGVRGHLWTTDKGERTVAVEELTVLNRAVRPMPDKWQGVSDTELRYRKRYLDLLMNDDSRRRFLVRSAVITRIRALLDAAGFLEVETPILQAAASGAAARPFSTHHNALDRDFYLRISPETYLKRVAAGSLEMVYELGRNFRNEGVDSSHLQEFTMLEWYAAYWDYRDNMAFVAELIATVMRDVVGSTVVEWGGTRLDFTPPWPEVDYRQAVADHTGIDLREVRDVEALRQAIRHHDLVGTLGLSDGEDHDGEDHDDEDHDDEDQDRAGDADGSSDHGAGTNERRPGLDSQVSYAGLVDLLYKRTVRPSLIQPCFLVHHPAELVPLARRSDEDPSRLDMFQVVVHGWEIVKAYSELVDAVEQRTRLEEQVALREAGDDETMMMEEDFLEAMEHGMPPMSGLGLGIDRFVALLTDSPTLRDVVLFPQMRDA
jgi:lysyl-tRNA synthetase, class II